MLIVAKLLTALVALLHFYFLWLEMFAWTTKGKKVFRNFPKDLFEPTKAMAANQGLYNGFLAAGLVWSIFISNPEWQFNVALFFLACVIVAALYGAIRVSKKIFFVQGVPAVLALTFLVLAYYL
ncbi:MAG: DUF1304 domain-containing protein [Bacteroidota bacterium]